MTWGTYRLVSAYTLPNQPKGRMHQLAVFFDREGAEDETLTLDHVPYIDENQRLRIWDFGKGEPLNLTGTGVVDGGLLPQAIQRRHPPLFSLAQQLGYWSNAT